jgi:quinol monooxygenase YgiN
MRRFVIASYRPSPGKAQQLLDLVRAHVPTLLDQGLVSDRPPYVMRAGDGTIVEVFEWRSTNAIADAHENPTVKALWARFEDVCEYVSLADLDECTGPFAEFEPVDL